MALPFEPMDRKFVKANGKFVDGKVESFDDWDNYGREFLPEFESNASLESGLSGRAKTLRASGATDQNHIRQRNVNYPRND